jgi:rfaE bifunctional protein kinase chain/domain/rfaE bifunctional protein nucleotidyltransferase chain/domain
MSVTNRKICGIERLLAVREEARAAGKKVVHCHGCFDIVHPGHIHHLQFAKSQGDVLVVTVSADPQVNKGLARPLIPDDLRAGSLAALECVDYVHVNNEPTAVGLLGKLRPDVYIKGREYETNNDPRFLAEKDTVMSGGGRVVFSAGDVVYSSTALIGQLEDAEVFNREKTRRFQEKFGLTHAYLHELVAGFRGKRVVVVGDYILDRYHFCDAVGVAGEAPMMTLRPLSTQEFDGGAAIIASHVARMGGTATLLTSLADDAASRTVEARLVEAGIDVQALSQRRQLVSKNRYLVDQTKMFKVDEGAVNPLDSQDEKVFADRVLAAATGADAVIFVDFGYGVLTGTLLERILPLVRQRVPVVTADVSGIRSNLLRFKDVDLVCPTERELRQTLNDHSSGLTNVVYRLMHEIRARNVAITLGKEGLVTFDQFVPTNGDETWERRLRSAYVPSLASHAVDPLGCGDALLSAATLSLAAGGSVQAAAFLGSCAAAVEVGRLGNHPVSAEQILMRVNQYQYREAARLAS